MKVYFSHQSSPPDRIDSSVSSSSLSGGDDLALLYLATLHALAYQTKHIIESCVEAGHAPITSIFVTGGLVKNPLYLQAHADVTELNNAANAEANILKDGEGSNKKLKPVKIFKQYLMRIILL